MLLQSALTYLDDNDNFMKNFGKTGFQEKEMRTVYSDSSGIQLMVK